jgi:hypothetical protein
MEVSDELHAPATLHTGKIALGAHWIGGWVGPTGGLDNMKKRKNLLLPGIEPQPCSTSLYRLSYHGRVKMSRWLISAENHTNKDACLLCMRRIP